ncbi:hypothetical protein IFM89_021504 [Coptis chinensis]|uniref:FBD domain-containing protein n=1 Tax=Coptis chinensis TaxID=261450 RepID=A0A835LG07_9MAGN|nr:hypothetical protein IFM89_021504 [Coptis chinensis]
MKSCIFSPPSDFKGFPTLKILYLNRAKVEDCSTLYSLLSNCPCLQRLGLLDCKFIKCLKVKTIPSLRNLSVSGIEHVEISNAPNLRYIQCSGYLQKLLVDNAPSLVTVDISLASFVRGTQPVQQVIKDLRPSIVSFSHVQFLSVGSNFPQLIYAECYLQRGEPIVFKNLKQFKLDGKIIDNLTLYAIVNFFSGCPVLENVTIDVRFPCLHGAWISEFMEKECVQGRLRHGFLLYNLKTVRLNGFSGRAEEMMLIKVLFDKAIVLEELFLYSMMACTTGEYELLQRLPKGSSSAKIIMENGLRLKYF